MKIQASLRAIYDAQKPLADRLRTDIDKTLKAAKNGRWHYESRVKEAESFCSKLETGRVTNPAALEDLLACTLVVPNSLDIPAAVGLIRELYEIVEQRPAREGETSKAADTFRFDDLRLYCRRSNDGTRPPDPLDGLIFEIQVKTFLQHAWAIATHDLSYKTAEVRWGKDRIVAHLKATVEHAEVSIMEADALSKSSILQLTDRKTRNTSNIIDILNKHWSNLELPSNVRGLAETISDILHYSDLKPEDLNTLLTEEKELHDGALPLNLSPYGIIIRLLILHRREALEKSLSRRKFRILLTPELNIPNDFPHNRHLGQVVRA